MNEEILHIIKYTHFFTATTLINKVSVITPIVTTLKHPVELLKQRFSHNIIYINRSASANDKYSDKRVFYLAGTAACFKSIILSTLHDNNVLYTSL